MAENILFLYHLTSSDKLSSILKDGLLPYNGHHCKEVGDRSSDVIFLCKEQDIKFWSKCFKDANILIEIDCTSIRSNLRRRCQHNAPSKFEYGCFVNILPDCFSRILKLENLKEMEEDTKISTRGDLNL